MIPNIMKTKGQLLNRYGVGSLAFSSLGLGDGSRWSVLGAHSRGFNSPQVHKFNRPTSGANHPWGTSSGRSRKDGVSTPAVILAYTLEESKGQNDVPRVSESVQEIREGPEGPSTLSLPQVLKNLHGAT